VVFSSAADAWYRFSAAAGPFLERHGLLAAALILLADEAGAPTPFPGNLIIIALGARAAEGGLSFWQVVAVLETVTVVGATILYALSRWAGRRLVVRYGRYVGVTAARLQAAEDWLRPRGGRAVFLGRLVLGLRNVTPIAAGVLAVPMRVFLPAMSLGALVYIIALAAAGRLLGAPLLDWLATKLGGWTMISSGETVSGLRALERLI